MSAQRASMPVRLARAGAAVLLIVLAAVIVVRLAGRRSGAPIPAPAGPPPEGRVDLQERVRHQEYKDGRAVVDVRGASFNRGPDGRNRLSGSVEVLNLGPAGETVSRLTADEVVYDSGSLRFTVTGHVRVEAGGLVLEGGSFDYNKESGLLGTTAGGRFASRTIEGEAPRISYREGAAEVRLDGGFRVRVMEPGAKDRGLDVSGDSFVYSRGGCTGRIDGNAVIEGAGFRGRATAASFVAAEDESGLVSAAFEGGARVAFSDRTGGATGGDILSDRIDVAFERDPAGPGSIRTSGRSSLTFRSDAERTETVLAEAVLLSFDREEGLWTWSASGGIRAEVAEKGTVRRSLEGERAAFDAAKVLRVSGGPGLPAMADSAEARVEAAELVVASGTGEVVASGGAACVLKKAKGERRIGFFSPLEDVSVSCERLELRPGSSGSLFKGRVFVRQGENAVRAEEIETAGETGGMTGRGGVAIVMVEPPSGGRAGRVIELGAEDMAYRPDTRTLTLSSKASVALPEARLEAGSVAAVIGADGRTVESLSAARSVTVSRGRYMGRADAASYEAATGRLTLTGKPVLADDKGGSARGAKLTFSLSDDKIFIENEGPGRATTVVRS